jgi:hypothetical protein
MDKLFTPNRWFVLFCGVFIGVFALLQFVITVRLEAVAKNVGTHVFSWVWREKNLSSNANMTQAKVLHRSANDAVVEVSGEQWIAALAKPQGNEPDKSSSSPGDRSAPMKLNQGEKSECKAVLTFYKQQNQWRLGKVELK